MDQNELEQIHTLTVEDPEIDVTELTGPARTLLYGYDVDRITWHVYLLGGQIHRRIYDTQAAMNRHEALTRWVIRDLIPNKRAYPNRTDFQFASICARRQEPITFTTWEPLRAEDAGKAFYGRID
jgi:hypothetical protein